MSEAITIARPYAQAAFEEAQELSDRRGWSEVLQSLAEAVSYSEIRTVISSPRVERTQLAGLLGDMLGGADTNRCTCSAATWPCRISISYALQVCITNSLSRVPTTPVSTLRRYLTIQTKWYLRSKRA